MSSSPMKAVLDVLAALDELEWVRCVGSDEPLRPPYIAWRFQAPASETEIAIVAAVTTYSGATAWTITKGGRNWVIGPLAFGNFARSFRTDTDASKCFADQFPEETRVALADAARLAEHLRRVLLPN